MLGADVHVPTDFDLPYQDLPLTTPDGVKLRCYLLTQHKELSNHGAKPIPSPEEESNEEVRSISYAVLPATTPLCMDVGQLVYVRVLP